MTRLSNLASIVCVAIFASTASAQFYHHDTFPRRTVASVPTSVQGHLHDHDYWHHTAHTVNLALLDTYADQLAVVARHLHEDAHRLSQDYEHSAAIESFVDQVDRLQTHLHELLHDAAAHGHQTSTIIQHTKSDVQQARNLFVGLYQELAHQGVDGARSGDFYAIQHMRQVITSEALPLIQRMELGLYGNSSHTGVHTSHRPVVAPHQTRFFRASFGF